LIDIVHDMKRLVLTASGGAGLCWIAVAGRDVASTIESTFRMWHPEVMAAIAGWQNL
jgi:hypothetical protein